MMKKKPSSIQGERVTRPARMSRTYALSKLLEHGPLTSKELPVITGWTKKECGKTVAWMQETNRISTVKWGVYCLPGDRCEAHRSVANSVFDLPRAASQV